MGRAAADVTPRPHHKCARAWRENTLEKMCLLSPEQAGEVYRYERWSEFDFQIRSLRLQDSPEYQELLGRIASLSTELNALGEMQKVGLFINYTDRCNSEAVIHFCSEWLLSLQLEGVPWWVDGEYSKEGSERYVNCDWCR